jgi:hypothetical protein
MNVLFLGEFHPAQYFHFRGRPIAGNLAQEDDRICNASGIGASVHHCRDVGGTAVGFSGLDATSL